LAAQLKQVRSELSPGAKIDIVAVAADPYHETLANVNHFISLHRLSEVKGFYFVTGTLASVRNVWHSYGIGVTMAPSAKMSIHSDYMFIINSRGRLKWIVPTIRSPTGPDNIQRKASCSPCCTSQVCTDRLRSATRRARSVLAVVGLRGLIVLMNAGEIGVPRVEFRVLLVENDGRARSLSSLILEQLPPHVHGVSAEQRPFKDVRHESVLPPSARRISNTNAGMQMSSARNNPTWILNALLVSLPMTGNLPVIDLASTGNASHRQACHRRVAPARAIICIFSSVGHSSVIVGSRTATIDSIH